MIIGKNLGKAIKRARLRGRIDLNALAGVFGIPEEDLRRMERGEYDLPARKVGIILQLVGHARTEKALAKDGRRSRLAQPV